jgi:hypothetical protein
MKTVDSEGVFSSVMMTVTAELGATVTWAVCVCYQRGAREEGKGSQQTRMKMKLASMAEAESKWHLCPKVHWTIGASRDPT